MKIMKVQGMEMRTQGGVQYYECGGSIYYPNPNDQRPSAQIYIGQAEPESQQLSLEKWVSV